MSPEVFMVSAAKGGHSCAAAAASWVVYRTCRDPLPVPAPAFAGPYLPLLVHRALKRVGCRRTDRPQCGDVGVLIVRGIAIIAVLGETFWLWIGHDGRLNGTLARGITPRFAWSLS